eukprot:jgi/Galph1/4886/GphlegSOOS_G3547.1
MSDTVFEKPPKLVRLSLSSPIRQNSSVPSFEEVSSKEILGLNKPGERLAKNQKVAIRATVGFFLLSLFIFVPNIAQYVPYTSLVAVDYIIIVTFGVEELEFGFVSEGAILSSAAQLLGSLLGALGALLTRTSSSLTLVTIFVGTALFTSLHGDSRLDMITSTGELNFVFNLLGSRIGSPKAIWQVFRDTMIAALLAHAASILVAITCFPRLAKNEMRRCMQMTLHEMGAALSGISSVLMEPYIENMIDFGDSAWKMETRFNPVFLVSCVSGKRLELARKYIIRAKKMAQYLPYEPNLLWLFPTRGLDPIIKRIEDLADEIGALHSVLHHDRRRYFGELLEHWPSIVVDLKYSFAEVASECFQLGDFLFKWKPSSLTTQSANDLQNDTSQSVPLRITREKAKMEYMSFLKGYSDTFSFPSALELGPFMFVLVMADSIRKKMEAVDKSTKKLSQQRKLRSIFLGSRNLFGWANILMFPFERWAFVLKNIPFSIHDIQSLWKSPELRFCLKKWIGEIVILIIVFYGWLPRFLSRWNGLLIWMAFVLYIQPTLEGTLIGALTNLLGVFFGALFGGILMSFKTIAMNPYILDSYLLIATFIAAYYINSNYSIVILNSIITQYVIVLGQYDSNEYLAQWYVPVGRCIMMSIGTVVAVIENEYLWPHSVILQVRITLSSCLQEMAECQSQLLNLAFRTNNSTQAIRKMSFQATIARSKNGYESIPSEMENNVTLQEQMVQKCKSMGESLDQVENWLNSVSSGIGGQIYGVPLTLKATLWTEKMLRQRMVAFASLIACDPDFIDQYWKSVHERFFKLSSKEAQFLMDARHSLVQVIISCILADAVNIPKSDTTESFSHKTDAWRNSQVSKGLEEKLKQEPLAEVSLESKHLDFVREVSNRILSHGLMARTPLSAPNLKREGFPRSVSYYTRSDISIPALYPSWFKAGAKDSSHIFTVSEERAASYSSREENPVAKSLQVLEEIQQLTTEDVQDKAASLSKQVSMVWEADVETQQEEQLNNLLDHTLQSPKSDWTFKYSYFFDFIQKYFITDAKTFKGIGEAVIKTVQALSMRIGDEKEASLKEEENEPVIIRNLEKEIDLFREAQGRFFVKFMELEVDFYRKLILQSIESDSYPSSTDDRVLYNYYELYSGPSFSEKHIFFLSLIFIASYTADGLKEVAKELLVALRAELYHLKKQDVMGIKGI